MTSFFSFSGFTESKTEDKLDSFSNEHKSNTNLSLTNSILFTKKYYRGARNDDSPSFAPKSNEYKIDKATGLVKNTHGVSVFDNKESVSKNGFTPHEVDLNTLSNKLKIKQRGNDPKHYEIMPKENMSLDDYKKELSKIKCK